MIANPPVQDFPSFVSVSPEPPAPRRVKVFVGICTRDWQIETHTSESVRGMANVCRCEIIVRYVMNDGVARSRNNLSAMMLEMEGFEPDDRILMLDNDIIPEPWQIDALVDLDLDIVGALYPKKQPKLEWVFNFLEGHLKPDERGVLKVKHAGTGGLMIKKKVLTGMIEKIPEMIYKGDPAPGATRWDFFPMHAKDGMYKSEDWFFCENARKCGFDVHVHTRIQLRHIGKIVYPIQFTLDDEEVVDVIQHRYGIPPENIRSFICSGDKTPGLWGGHRGRKVRLWPEHYAVVDLHDGGILAGCFDVPLDFDKPPTVVDIGAGVGAYARFVAKRWPGCKLTCYEGDAKLVPYLQETVANRAPGSVLIAKAVRGMGDGNGSIGADAIPSADVLKIDAKGVEREILQVLMPRLGEFAAVVVRYSDENDIFLLRALMGATHEIQFFQRFDRTSGIVKFLRREQRAGGVPSGGG